MIVCDECGASEMVPCDYERKGRDKWEANQGQARKKIQGHGWSVVKRREYCPACTASRKVVNMSDVKARNETANQPTKAQKRSIMQMLDECYDTGAERYMQGETDDTIADVLGVMPGWVTELREEFFGPAGVNENMEALALEVDTLRRDLAAAIKKNTEFNDQVIAGLERVKDIAGQLDRIKVAVGPRNQKKAGVPAP